MNGPGTELTVGAVTRHYARVAPAKCALYDGERSLAYGEVDAMVDALASALVRDGVARGDVVSAYLPNCIDYVVVVLAVARADAVCPVGIPLCDGIAKLGDVLANESP